MRGRLDAQGWLFLAAGALAILILGVRVAQDALVYNASSSIPRGWYLRDGGAVVRGAIVTVRARDVSPDYARQRHFTDIGDRFIKRVAAIDGDVVCASGDRVVVDGGTSVRRLESDSVGRTLPTWSGCRRLRNEVFLLGDTGDSFDGRYWGPTPARLIEGVWRPLAPR